MKKVLITGGCGFLGQHICEEAKNFPYDIWTIGSGKKFDLSDFDICYNFFDYFYPDIVIHCAGYNGGIEFNDLYPADVFHINTQIALNIFQCCKEFKTEKLVSMITSCAYPNDDYDMKEDQLWNGYPHESVACHGLAKRNLDTLSRLYYKQYGLKSINIIFNTLYGPGDTFNLTKAKVLTSLILKFYTAKKRMDNGSKDETVYLYGDGMATREFVYVKDAAKLVFQALDRYDDPNCPLNISSGQEYRIDDLANKVKEIIGYKGNVCFNGHLCGQARKHLNVDKMKCILGDIEFTSIEDGIIETIKWLNDIGWEGIKND